MGLAGWFVFPSAIDIWPGLTRGGRRRREEEGGVFLIANINVSLASAFE